MFCWVLFFWCVLVLLLSISDSCSKRFSRARCDARTNAFPRPLVSGVAGVIGGAPRVLQEHRGEDGAAAAGEQQRGGGGGRGRRRTPLSLPAQYRLRPTAQGSRDSRVTVNHPSGRSAAHALTSPSSRHFLPCPHIHTHLFSPKLSSDMFPTEFAKRKKNCLVRSYEFVLWAWAQNPFRVAKTETRRRKLSVPLPSLLSSHSSCKWIGHC